MLGGDDWAERFDERSGRVAQGLARYQGIRMAIVMIALTVGLLVALIRSIVYRRTADPHCRRSHC